MLSSRSSLNSLLAAATIAAMGAAISTEGSLAPRRSTSRRSTKQVHRMPRIERYKSQNNGADSYTHAMICSPQSEISEWNRKVEMKKAGIKV